MAKPIFIVKIPVRIADEHHRAQLERIGKDLQTKLDGYYVLTLAENRNDEKGIQFECYNTTDLDAKSFEDLKEMANHRWNELDTDNFSDWDVTLMDGLEDEEK